MKFGFLMQSKSVNLERIWKHREYSGQVLCIPGSMRSWPFMKFGAGKGGPGLAHCYFFWLVPFFADFNSLDFMAIFSSISVVTDLGRSMG